MATIYKSGVRMIRNNFHESELYSTSTNAPDSHFLSDTTLDVLQKFRDWSNARIKVTSTFRTQFHQDLLVKRGLTTTKDSQHSRGRAIDFQWIGSANNTKYMTRLRKAFACPSQAPQEDVDFITDILGIGIGKIHRIGMYEWGIHIDDKQDGDFYVPVTMWDDTNMKFDNYILNTSWYNFSIANNGSVYCEDPDIDKGKKKSEFALILDALFFGTGEGYEEDGFSVQEPRIWKWLLILIILILGYIAYKQWS